jgi:flavodoxin
MSVNVQEQAGGKVLVVNLGGKLTRDDYQHFVPEVDRLIRQHGKVCMLVRMHDFHGWTLGRCGRTSSST